MGESVRWRLVSTSPFIMDGCHVVVNVVHRECIQLDLDKRAGVENPSDGRAPNIKKDNNNQ